MAKRGKTKVTRAMINQEITRIRNIVREAEKLGYEFGDVIPKNVNVTKSQLSKLRSVTRDKLLSTARLRNEVGEYLPTNAEKNREQKIEIKKRKKKKLHEKQRVQQVRRNRRQRINQNTNDTHIDDYSYTNDIQTDYPTISIIDVIREKIRDLPSERGFAKKGVRYHVVDLEGKKSILESILDDAYMFAEDLTQLEQYYIDNQDRIIELLEIITYDSESDNVEVSFVTLGIILKGSALTMSEAQDISEMADMMNGY